MRAQRARRRRGFAGGRRLPGALAFLGAWLEARPACAAATFLDPGNIPVVVAFGALALAAALGILALIAMRTRDERLGGLERENAILRDKLAREESMLAADPGGVFVWAHGAAEAEAHGSLRGALAAALAGPDGLTLAAAIEKLSSGGEPFSFDVRGDDGKRYRAEGRPAGAEPALWLRETEAAGEPAPGESARRAEEERDRLAALLDALPAPIWRRGKDLTLDYANAAYVSAAGASARAAVLSAQTEIAKREAQLAREARETQSTVREKRYVVLGGQRRALALIETPAENSVAGIAIDVTALDEAEQRLQRHMDAHEETLNKLPTAVAAFGADQRLAFYNRAYAQLFAFDESFLDRHPTEGEILERLRTLRKLPEQRDFQQWKRERLALYARPDANVDELWHLPDGATIHVMAQPHPFGGLLFLYDDVTDKLMKERRYNTLINVQRETLDSLSEGVAVFGPDGRLQLSNAAFSAIWQIAARGLEGNPHFSEVSALCRGLIAGDEAWEKLAGQVTGFSTERESVSGTLTRADGRVLSYAGVPLPDGATLISFVDITDSVRAEQRLRERNEALEAADRLKTEFVSHVSYQLRTPLASIIGFAEMLEQNFAGALSDKQGGYVANILEAATGLRALINDILDLAVIDAGAMELDLKQIDVGETLMAVLPLVAQRAEKLGVSVAGAIEPSAGRILADERRVKQIVFNLLTNALNFTPPSGSVTLAARAEGAGVAISVTDTGRGIPPEYLPRAFERFESRAGLGKRGAGLGLALVKSFVELHGGWVEIESAQGAGTRVTCRLPREPFGAQRQAQES